MQGGADTVVRPSTATGWPTSGSRTGPPPAGADPVGRSRSESGRTPDGRRYQVLRWYTARGRKVLEYWLVDGLGHAWSGGRKDGSFSDPDGPRATTSMWAFFRLHALDRRVRRPVRAAGA